MVKTSPLGQLVAHLAAYAGTCIALILGVSSSCFAETTEFRIARQPGLSSLPVVLMLEKGLIEKQSAARGLPGVTIAWSTIASGGGITEALLSDSIDLATTGISNTLLMWSRTNGGVKAVAGVAGLPQLLLTRNPDVKTIKDFGPSDRIAVPTIRASLQAMVLGMALEQAYGLGAHGKLDSIQVQMGHPDATQALLNPHHEVNSHFSIPPFSNIELKGSPAIHLVLDSSDVLGGPGTTSNTAVMQKFADANPIKMAAYLAALDEAIEMIAKDPKGVAETYLAVTKEKISVDELVALIAMPGAIFSAAPQGSMKYADYMHRIGMIKIKPASWKDYFLPAIHNRSGS